MKEKNIAKITLFIKKDFTTFFAYVKQLLACIKNFSHFTMGVRMQKWISIFVLFLSFIFIPLFGHAQNNNISVGYGFGAFNGNQGIGKLRGTNGYYDFFQLAYSREKSLSSRTNLLLEPFLAYVNRPTDGLDLGMTVGLRFYLNKDTKKGLFGTLAMGASYTTIGFVEQDTHLLFMLQGGIGYKWNKYFVENRFRHYSNGSLTSPNRAINANIINIGISF